MSSLSGMIEQIRGFDLERVLGLRAATPKVALELDCHEIALVRLKQARGSLPLLEVHRVQREEQPGIPATLFDPKTIDAGRLSQRMKQLYDDSGVRPGNVSIVLPDNLAKISLLTLPERPPSRRQLEELVRFKMRRSVPFRLSDGMLSFQQLAGGGKGVSVLVALTRRAIVERCEQALEAIGARPGMVDLCTLNLLNLCREQIGNAGKEGRDVALLNCARSYFSLVIMREGQLIFFRCKTYAMGDDRPPDVDGLLGREVAGSFSYYEEKLSGSRIGTMIVRSGGPPFDELRRQIEGLPIDEIAPVDVGSRLAPNNGGTLDPLVLQRIAPAVGAALGRG